MKKISLKNLNLKEVEQLSREQLKDVLGGSLGSTDIVGSETNNCISSCTKIGDSCDTSDCKPGTCRYMSASFYCLAD